MVFVPSFLHAQVRAKYLPLLQHLHFAYSEKQKCAQDFTFKRLVKLILCNFSQKPDISIIKHDFPHIKIQITMF